MRNPIVMCAVAASMLALGACSNKKEGNKDGQAAPATGKGQGAAANSKARTLEVYSGRTEKLIAPVIEMFENKTGVDVKVKYADTAQLAATILEEGKRSPADVFLAQDASSLGLLEQQGMFAPLPESLTSKLHPSLKSAAGKWVAMSGRARVLAYNTSKLKPADLPKTAAELVDPKWKGRVGWAPENASFQSAISAMIQLEGEDATRAWVEAMQANEPRAYPKNTPAVLAVSRGEVDVALVNHYYLHRLRDEHGADFPVANHYFRSGKADSLINVSGAAILATSDDMDTAREFVEFLLSPTAQAYFVKDNYEFPVVTGLAGPMGLPEVGTLNAPVVDLAKLQDLETTHKLLRAAGVLR